MWCWKMRLFLRVFKQCDPFKAKEVLHRLINDPPAGVTLNSDPYANSTEFKHVGWPVRAAAAVVTIFMGFCHCHSKQAHLWHAISSAAAFYGDRKLHLLVQNAIVWNKTLGVVRETNCDLEQISLFPTRNTLVCLLVHSNEVSCQLLASFFHTKTILVSLIWHFDNFLVFPISFQVQSQVSNIIYWIFCQFYRMPTLKKYLRFENPIL